MANKRQGKIKPTGNDDRRIERRPLPSLTTDQKADLIVACFGREVLERCRKIRRGEEVVENQESG